MQLKPHQATGADFLERRKFALLADEMRVGKTLAALEAARRNNVADLLVACPAVARFNWARNIQEHLGVTPRVVMRRTDRPSGGVVVTSYDLAENLAGTHWDAIIMDESHFLRHCTAERTKRLLGKGGLIHNTEHAWFLSGTPAVNHYAELWPMLYVCGVYKHSYETFVREFCTGHYGPYGFQITGSKNHDRLRALMDDFWLRRKFSEIAPHLPPIELSDYTVELPRAAGVLDSPVLRQCLEAKDPMAAIEAQAPAVATLRRYIGLAKVPAVIDLVRATLDGNNDKLVLFTYHRDVLTGLMRGLAEFSPVSLAGGDTPTSKNAAEVRFRDDPRCRVFVGQIIAAGTNIDLSAASEAFMVESSWTPGENAQALMRIQNMNNVVPKFARFIGMVDSLDQAIQRLVMRKTRDLDKLFG